VKRKKVNSRPLRRRYGLKSTSDRAPSLTTGLLQHSSGNKKMEQDANKDTEKKLAEIKDISKSKGSKVVNDLLSAVIDVDPEPPSKA
jgi:Vacuolar (H+)-ATPase G subunit